VTVTESGIRTPAHFADNSQGWDEELGQLVEYRPDDPDRRRSRCTTGGPDAWV